MIQSRRVDNRTAGRKRAATERQGVSLPSSRETVSLRFTVL